MPPKERNSEPNPRAEKNLRRENRVKPRSFLFASDKTVHLQSLNPERILRHNQGSPPAGAGEGWDGGYHPHPCPLPSRERGDDNYGWRLRGLWNHQDPVNFREGSA